MKRFEPVKRQTHYGLLALILMLVVSVDAIACPKVTQPIYNETSYYSGLNGLSGESLRSALNGKINAHQYYAYSPCTWAILEEADVDPNDSSAVIGFYTRRSIPIVNRDQGGNTPDYWNREHIWPKSHGFSSKNQYAHTDAHHLRASDKSVNADRGSRDFAEGGSPHYECDGCRSTGSTWEPPNEVKGDTARMMFYMDVRYDGNDSSSVGDLELVDGLTSSGQLAMGDLCDLMDWHIADPVSQEEQQRNDIIYSWQGNRNPFIDHPEFAVSIWGPACGISLPSEPTQEQVPTPYWVFLLIASGIFVIATVARRV
ncbi:MAG: endonuclease [Pseudomonadales bacterium]|nr:endonuclease [Pseudomonadales bacterium]